MVSIKKGGIEEKLIRNYNCKKVLHENKIDWSWWCIALLI